MAAGRFPCGLRFSTRGVHLSSGLFQTRLRTLLYWIFVSGVTCIIPKATLRSLHRCSPSRRVERQRPKFCSQDRRLGSRGAPRIPRVNSEKNCGGWPCVVVASLSQCFVIRSAVRIIFAESLGFAAEFSFGREQIVGEKPPAILHQLLITTL